MTTKLTLTMSKSTIEKGKRYAKKQKRSLSKIIETYINAITDDDVSKEEDMEELSPVVKSLMGSFKAPKDFDVDYKKERLKRLEEKYL